VEKAAFLMKEEGFAFAKFDGHTYKDISKNYDVTGYPTVLYFTEFGKNKVKYDEGRTYDAIQLWLY